MKDNIILYLLVDKHNVPLGEPRDTEEGAWLSNMPLLIDFGALSCETKYRQVIHNLKQKNKVIELEYIRK